MRGIIPYEDLPSFEELFDPDFENGKLYWKEDHKRRDGHPHSCAGKEAGGLKPGRTVKPGYWQIHLDQQKGKCRHFLRGKILYYLKYGIWPPEIDHINRNPLDDRLSNLRETSTNKNMWNRATTHPGKELPYGVKYRPLSSRRKNKLFTVNVSQYGKDAYIGDFSTPEEAKEAYDNFYKRYYGKDLTVDYYSEIEQGSPEWHHLRRNRITGTSAYKVLQGKTVDEVINSLKKQKSFHGNYYTQRGHVLEAEARDIYSQANNTEVHEVGAIINSKYPRTLVSPDGIVGLDGLIEVKCFQPKRHLKVYKTLDPAILAQIQFGLFVSEREWCDLLLYNPEMPDTKDCFLIRRIEPIPKTQELFKKLFKVKLLEEKT